MGERTRRVRGSTDQRRPVYDAQSLTAIAAREFLDRGYEATTMEHLAMAAGITKSSFYYHVRGKEQLLRAALERATDALFAILDEHYANVGQPLQRLQYVVRRQVEVLMAELPYVTLLLRERGDTHAAQWALARRRAFDRAVAGLIEEAVEEHQVRPDVDPALAARLVSGLVNSLTEWWQPGRRPPTVLPDDIVAAVISGIVPPANRRRG